jgi:excisionase family DNA binding protein
MTTQQAARKLGVTRAFVGRLLRNDVLTGEKVAGHGMGGLVWRIAADSVEELVEARA